MDSEVPSLSYCIRDVCALEEVLTGLGYGVVCMHDEVEEGGGQPLRNNVTSALKRMCLEAQPSDLLLVHMSCHGVLDDGKTLLIMQDTHLNELKLQALPLSLIEEQLRASKALRKVLILDACHSGVELGRGLDGPDFQKFLQHAYEAATGFALLAGSTAKQRAYESKEKQNGVFTYFLLQGLTGAADDQNKRFVTVNDLSEYVAAEVRRWSWEHKLSLQEPTSRTEGNGSMILADFRQSRRFTAAAPAAPAIPPMPPAAARAELRQPLHPVIQYCSRAEQWIAVEQLIGRQEPASSLVFIPGARGQAHEYFVERLQALEGESKAVLLDVSWQMPLPPPQDNHYLEALATSLQTPPGVDRIASRLVQLARGRRLILRHPILYQKFNHEGLVDYYTRCWRSLVEAIGKASGPGSGDSFRGVVCIQPLEWEPGRGLRQLLARLLHQAWPYPRKWVEEAKTEVQAYQLIKAVRGRRSPLGIYPLKELGMLTAEDVSSYYKLQGFADADEELIAQHVAEVFSGAQNAKQVLDALIKLFPRHKAEYDAQQRSQAEPREKEGLEDGPRTATA